MRNEKRISENSKGKVRDQDRPTLEPTCFVSEKGVGPIGNASDFWHPPECSFHQKKGIANLGVRLRLRLGVEPKKRNKSVVVVNTLDHTQAEG